MREVELASSDADLAHERAYVEWAYERLDEMIRGLGRAERAAGDVATHRALKRMDEARREDLMAARQALVIGRLDFTADRADELGSETLYVGKTHVDGVGPNEVAVMDWRSDAAEAFYRASRSDPRGVGRRRTIAMRNSSVTGISDDLLIKGYAPPVAQPLVEAPPVEAPSRAPQPRVARSRSPKPRAAGERIREHSSGTATSAGGGSRQPRTPRSPRPSRTRAVAGEVVGEARTQDPEAPDDELTVDEREPAGIVEFEIRAEDLLLTELARERSDEMTEVVATIQADQDRLIRAESSIPLIIQGGPGTGKTIVGLHRAAYVLYDQRLRGAKTSLLFVGPNLAFIDYVRGVLPSLGESSAAQVTLDQLSVTNVPKSATPKVRSVASVGAARALGDPRMVEAVRLAVWGRCRPRPLEIGFGRFVLRLAEEQVAAVFAALRASTDSYVEARSNLALGLADAFLQSLVTRERLSVGRAADLEEIRTRTRRLLDEGDLGEELMPKMDPRSVVAHVVGDSDLLQQAGFDADEVDAVHMDRPASGVYPWCREHLPLFDEAATVLRGEPMSYAHVVIDEAQDLSPMQWRVIARRAEQGSMTILGDLAQALSPWSPESWTAVAERAGVEGRTTTGELRLGYRVPRQVMDFVEPLSKVAAPGLKSPVSFRSGPAPEVVEVSSEALRRKVVTVVDAAVPGTVAVVCPDALRSDLAKDLKGKDYAHVSVLTAEQARGREFDTTCVVEPAGIAEESSQPAQALYVALTRPTKVLVVVHSAPLPPVMRGEMPRPVEPPPARPTPPLVWAPAPTDGEAVVEASPSPSPPISSLPPPASQPLVSEPPTSSSPNLVGLVPMPPPADSVPPESRSTFADLEESGRRLVSGVRRMWRERRKLDGRPTGPAEPEGPSPDQTASEGGSRPEVVGDQLAPLGGDVERDDAPSPAMDPTAGSLMTLLEGIQAQGPQVFTISQGKPNWITAIAPEGVYIETERSRVRSERPQLVPMWMIETAWRELTEAGSLTQSYLVATDGLNVKRSAAVMALLARFPRVSIASTKPTRLVYEQPPPSSPSN